MAVRALLSGALAGAASVVALRLLRDTPPGGPVLWDRTNHAGRPVSLLEGPAYVLGSAAGALAGGPGPVVWVFPHWGWVGPVRGRAGKTAVAFTPPAV